MTETTVLVIEDDPQLNELYSQWLAASFDVKSATDGTEGLSKLDDDVDVVLLDRELPDVSGDTILASQDDRNVDCLVGVVSGIRPDIDTLHMDFDAYLEKPVREGQLERFVNGMLEEDTVGVAKIQGATL
jgi:two-component system response regulator AdeR